MHKLKLYVALMRLHKPIGILLLLWPTLWALWIAANGLPSIKNIVIFVAGVILMRSAGCVINDVADRRFDLKVKRTQHRPITSGKIAVRDAMILFFSLCFISFLLVLMTNKLTLLLSCGAVITAAIYPFMKRYTHWPQFILGIAFSFSIPMAFAAETNHVPFIALFIMLINVIWTILYDTEYAMTDREDDLKIGIKSTAILFGQQDKLIIGLLQLIVIALLCVLGFLQSFSFYYFIAVFIVFLLFCYQQRLISERVSEKCFCAFVNNQWVGAVVFAGVLLVVGRAR